MSETLDGEYSEIKEIGHMKNIKIPGTYLKVETEQAGLVRDWLDSMTTAF